MASNADDESDLEQEFSGAEQGAVTWKEARRFKLAFGMYRGKTLEAMIKTKKRRDYLKYLLSWDQLKEDTQGNIQAAMEHYEDLKSSMH